MDRKHRTFLTITPSEPIVAHVAAIIETHAWPRTLSLSDTLLRLGLVEKCLKGELYVRIMFVIARDSLIHRTIKEGNGTNWSGSFLLLDFLTRLLIPSHAERILAFSPPPIGVHIQTDMGPDIQDFQSCYPYSGLFNSVGVTRVASRPPPGSRFAAVSDATQLGYHHPFILHGKSRGSQDHSFKWLLRDTIHISGQSETTVSRRSGKSIQFYERSWIW